MPVDVWGAFGVGKNLVDRLHTIFLRKGNVADVSTYAYTVAMWVRELVSGIVPARTILGSKVGRYTGALRH